VLQVGLSTYHWSDVSRAAFDAPLVGSNITGNAARFAELLCSTNVVLRPDCPETHSAVTFEFFTDTAFIDVYFDAHAMLDSRDQVYTPNFAGSANEFERLKSTTRQVPTTLLPHTLSWLCAARADIPPCHPPTSTRHALTVSKRR
jgi:hypothetical protein